MNMKNGNGKWAQKMIVRGGECDQSTLNTGVGWHNETHYLHN